MTQFKVGDKVFVDGFADDMDWFDPSVEREVFLHEETGQLRVYDDEEVSGDTSTEGWWIDGFAIRDIIRHV